MVHSSYLIGDIVIHLSVLALSSRFDGRELQVAVDAITGSFSTRSVESF